MNSVSMVFALMSRSCFPLTEPGLTGSEKVRYSTSGCVPSFSSTSAAMSAGQTPSVKALALVFVSAPTVI